MGKVIHVGELGDFRMKIKILFIAQYLQTGGVERSLLALLHQLDYEKYEVDLLLFDYSGVLFSQVPREVNLLPPLFETFSLPLGQAIPQLVRGKQYSLLAAKLLSALAGRLSKGVGTARRWSVYRSTLPANEKVYDAAVSYLDFFCNYYVIEKVNAKRKIVYNHMDYHYSMGQGWPAPELDEKVFAKSNWIVCVSESASRSLKEYFPGISSKIKVIHNRVSPASIRLQAKEPMGLSEEFAEANSVVTVARLVEEKGIWEAVDACKMLVERGVKIQWYWIGNGPELHSLEKKVEEYGLEKCFHLLGEKANPYPYMKNSMIYVQPSRTEAHCVAVEEALTLGCPVVVTDIPSFRGQIRNGETGIIAESGTTGLADAIEQLLISAEGRTVLKDHLARRNKQGLDQIHPLVHLLDGR